MASEPRRLTVLIALASVLMVGAPVVATQSGEEPPPQFGVDEDIRTPAILAPALQQADLTGRELPLFVRLVVDEVPPANDDSAFRPIDERMALYESLGVQVLLVLSSLPASVEQADVWRDSIRVMAQRYQGRAFGYQIGLRIDPGSSDVVDAALSYAFYLKLASVQLRSVDDDALVVQAPSVDGDSAWHAELFRQGVAPYIDSVAVIGSTRGSADVSGTEQRVDSVRTLLDTEAPGATIMVSGLPLGTDREAGQNWLMSQFSFAGDAPTLRTFAASPRALARALRTAASLEDLLGDEIVTLDETAASLRLTLDGRDVTDLVPHRLLYNITRFSTVLVYWATDGVGGTLQVELIDQTGRTPAVINAIAGQVTAPSAFAWDTETARTRVSVPLSNDPMVLDFDYGGGDVYVDRVTVSQTPALTINEIIFRHQQAQAAQDALYSRYVASARMEQHFRPTPTDAVDVVSENRYYFDAGEVEWEELSFWVNGARWGANRPPFPLLSAEKVLSLPFDLRLTADYQYRLDGTESLDERASYVVSFEPIGENQTFYRGRVWIDQDSFVKLKVEAVQRNLSAPAVSNEETQFFEPVAQVDGEPLYLFSRISNRQIFLIAGRNLLVEKEVRFSDFQVDSDRFVELRDAARASERIMYRDTAEGLRYLVKQGDERVVSDRATMSAKALVMGTTVDPSFDFPLPVFGINYLDFDFLSEDTQLALLFAGVLALGNIQAAKLGGTPFDASVDFFGIAVPSNDQIFDAVGERRDERILSIPASVGVNLGYQFTDFQKISANYQFQYNAYLRDDETAADFVMPSNTGTNGVGLAYEFSRWGYTFEASASEFRRTTWNEWGVNGEEFDSSHRRYRRYGVSFAKDFRLSTFQRFRLNGSWFGGENLDRFSKYQFGLFDETRMHGVPSGGVRFARLAMLRGSYSFNVFDQYRLDLFLDQAFGCEPCDSDQIWQVVTGTGVAFNLKGPWNTIFKADVGKSFLPDIYAGAGSVVVQIQLLKPL